MNHFAYAPFSRDLSPWLSIRSIGKYLDMKSPKTVRRFIEDNRDMLEIRVVGGGNKPRIRVKLSSIERALER